MNTDAFIALMRSIGLPEPVTEYRFAPPRRWRFDYAWPAAKVALEIEGGTWTGGRHVRGKGYERDVEKYNAAALAAWTVLRVTTGMIRDGRAFALLDAARTRLLPAPAGGPDADEGEAECREACCEKR